MTATLSPPKPRIEPEDLTTDDEPKPWKFTRDEFHQMGELGFFTDQSVELVDGRIYVMSPINESHVSAVTLATEALRVIFYPGFTIRTQAPLDFGMKHQPQPDLSVIAGSAKGRRITPNSALLVVEVADTSVQYDTNDKMSLYASAGILDYWVIDLKQQCVHVFRDPQPDALQPFAVGYANRRTYTLSDRIVPLAAPNSASVAVVDLLP